MLRLTSLSLYRKNLNSKHHSIKPRTQNQKTTRSPTSLYHTTLFRYKSLDNLQQKKQMKNQNANTNQKPEQKKGEKQNILLYISERLKIVSIGIFFIFWRLFEELGDFFFFLNWSFLKVVLIFDFSWVFLIWVGNYYFGCLQ